MQVLGVRLGLLQTQLNELLGVFLVQIVLQPGQVELVEAKADQVQESLDVIYRKCGRIHFVLADGCKHRIALE